MMTIHGLYVTAAYAASAIGLFCLVAWVLLDRRGRRLDLKALEADGVRRRSGQGIDTP